MFRIAIVETCEQEPLYNAKCWESGSKPEDLRLNRLTFLARDGCIKPVSSLSKSSSQAQPRRAVGAQAA